jgi:hypothetical protein
MSIFCKLFRAKKCPVKCLIDLRTKITNQFLGVFSYGDFLVTILISISRGDFLVTFLISISRGDFLVLFLRSISHGRFVVLFLRSISHGHFVFQILDLSS